MKKKNNVVVDALSRRPSISLMDVAENWKATLEVEYSCNVPDPLIDEEDAIIHQIIHGYSPMNTNVHNYAAEA